MPQNPKKVTATPHHANDYVDHQVGSRIEYAVAIEQYGTAGK